MKLKSVDISNLRSIDQVTLANCGEFNVLIGKNNSGKSNILSAIQAFFTCVHDGSVVVAEPPFGKNIDFFNRSSKQPIHIILAFSLTLPERDSLVQDIVNEAPQMRNAIEGIDPSLELIVTVTIIPLRNPIGLVSKIVLGSSSSSGSREKLILKISNEAALELNKRFSNSRRQNKQIIALQALPRFFDSENWRRLQQDVIPGSKSRNSIRNVLRRIPPVISEDLSESTIDRLDTLISDASSYDEFVRVSQALVKKLEEEAAIIQDEPLKNKIDTFAGEEVIIPHYVQNLLARIGQMKLLYLKEQRKQIGKEEAARLLTLKTRRGGPEILRNLQETVSALLGVKIDAFESDVTSSAGKSIAELDVDDFLVEVNGSGIREALRLVLEVEFEQPEILLVEEPEIHLHPALETSMMRYLQRTSNDRQVFITTHSTNFIDTAEMKNVYLISKPHSTQVQLLNFEEAEIEIPRELGIRPSSLFMFDRLVFIEGLSDAAIIREWASILGINLSRSNVGFITMEGSRNIAHFAAPATLSFLRKRQVKLWMLIDHDERDDAEILRLKNSLGQRANIRVLKKREIENYLICPRAITKFIELKKELGLSEKGNGGALPSISDVKTALELCTENLKQFAIDKRVVRQLCTPIRPIMNWHLDNRPKIVTQVIEANLKIIKQLEADNNRAEEIYEEQARLVNEMWQSSKLDLVPGDHLLDMVCQKFGVRYKKELDGSRLAALMNQQEINEEIKVIISEIGSEAV